MERACAILPIVRGWLRGWRKVVGGQEDMIEDAALTMSRERDSAKNRAAA